MENKETENKPGNKIKKTIDEKIDEFIEESFPASDPPNWSSLQDLEREKKAKEEEKKS